MTEVKSADLANAFQQVYNSYTESGHAYIRVSNGKLEVSNEREGHASFSVISQLVEESLQNETDISRLVKIKRGYSEIKTRFDNNHRSLWGLFKYYIGGGIAQTQQSDRIMEEIDEKIEALSLKIGQSLGDYSDAFVLGGAEEMEIKWENCNEGDFILWFNETENSMIFKQKLPNGESYEKQISPDFSKTKEESSNLLSANGQFLILQEKGYALGINIDLEGQPLKDLEDLDDRAFTDDELKCNLKDFKQLEEKGDFRLYKRWEDKEEKYTLFVRGSKDIEIIPLEDTSNLISQVVDARNRIMEKAA